MTTTLYLGDCLDHLQRIPSKSVNAIICDLPYGCLTTLNKCAWDIIIDMDKWWKQVKRILKDDKSPVLLWGNMEFFIKVLYPSNPKWFRYEIPVKKEYFTDFLNAKRKPGLDYEYLYVFCPKLPYYHLLDHHKPLPTHRKGNRSGIWQGVTKLAKQGKQEPTSAYEPALPRRLTITKMPWKRVFYFGRNFVNKYCHPTQKPLAAGFDIYKYFLKKGDTVCDPTMGSGSTGIIAKHAGWNFIGIEMNPQYYYRAVQNIMFPNNRLPQPHKNYEDEINYITSYKNIQEQEQEQANHSSQP